jgi:pimeloyl-ACP methyl ester carboxylesterase
VLLHGDGGSLLDFTMSPVFDRLAEQYHVVAFDRPGHGYSDAPAAATATTTG